jgi:transposase
MPLPHLQLNDRQREDLERLTGSGTLPARMFKRARALLLLDQSHTLTSVADLLSVSANSVGNWRDRFKTEALAMLFDKPRSGRPIEIDGTAQAKVTALAVRTRQWAGPAGRSACWQTRPSNSATASTFRIRTCERS